MMDTILNAPTPLAIGGVGGSGTRVIATIIEKLGFHIGSDLNEPLDNLWFTLLFKHRDVRSLAEPEFQRFYSIFRQAMTDGECVPALTEAESDALLAYDRRHLHGRDWLSNRLRTLHHAHLSPSRGTKRWAWKEPNTHMVLDRLLRIEPSLKYIHLMRNGLDMAVSQNQNQLKLWSSELLGCETSYSPAASLKFWCAAHRQVLRYAQASPERVLMLRFEDLCRDPAPEIERLLTFIGLEPADKLIASLVALVEPPTTMMRYRAVGLDAFEPEDVAFVRELGFRVE